MTSTAVTNNQESATKFLESLQADLKVLAAETKKKFPQIKEVRYMLLCQIQCTVGLGYVNMQCKTNPFLLFTSALHISFFSSQFFDVFRNSILWSV